MGGYRLVCVITRFSDQIDSLKQTQMIVTATFDKTSRRH